MAPWLVIQASLSTASSESTGCFQVSIAITSPPAMGGMATRPWGPQYAPQALVPAHFLPIIPSRPWRCAQPSAQHGALQRPFFIPWKFPAHPFLPLSLNNDPICLFKGLLSPYKFCRESLQLILVWRIKHIFCFKTWKKQFTCEALGWCLVTEGKHNSAPSSKYNEKNLTSWGRSEEEHFFFFEKAVRPWELGRSPSLAQESSSLSNGEHRSIIWLMVCLRKSRRNGYFL